MKILLAHRPSTQHNRFIRQKPDLRGKAAAWVAILGLFVILSSLVACAAAPAQARVTTPTPDQALTQTFSAALALARQPLPSATPTTTVTKPAPTTTPTATFTVTPIRTPPALPGVFTSSILTKDVIPQTYIQDTCTYLKQRWDPNNSAPGTVVMIVMFHSVTEDSNPLAPDGSQVHHSDLVMFMEHAHEVGFHTITVPQLADFLDRNAKIPPRSLLIIVDDRKRKEYYETHFAHYLTKYGWSITNAWISAKDTPEYLWKENQEVVAKGWVDPQAHGVVHNIPIGENSSEDYIRGELEGSISAIEKWYGKRPLGFIWPGGGFTKRAVELAREAGYRAGFTTNPRGPVMFNWVPQAEKADANHPYWLPEIPAGDPRMTLPRYWSLDAAYRVDDVIGIGDEAVEAAKKNQSTELEYYDIVCKGKTGPIPTAKP